MRVTLPPPPWSREQEGYCETKRKRWPRAKRIATAARLKNKPLRQETKDLRRVDASDWLAFSSRLYNFWGWTIVVESLSLSLFFSLSHPIIYTSVVVIIIMRVLVGVKRVVDYAVKVRVANGTVDLANVKQSMNPFCEVRERENKIFYTTLFLLK